MAETLELHGTTFHELGSRIEHMGEYDHYGLLLRIIRVEGRRSGLISALKERDNEEISEIASPPSCENAKTYAGANPWDDLPLPIFDERQQPTYQKDRPQFTGHFRLQSLPNELICEIAKLLPPESAAALALVNYRLRGLLGDRYITLLCRPRRQENYQARLNFLALLERDCHFLIACYTCKILHHPMKHPGTSQVAKEFQRLLPNVMVHIVRAIAIKQALGQGYEEECRKLLDLAGGINSVVDIGVRAAWTLTTRFVDNNLIRRSQILIAPRVNNGNLTAKSFNLLVDTLTKPSLQICEHFNWIAFLEFLNTAGDSCQDQFRSPYKRSVHEWCPTRHLYAGPKHHGAWDQNRDARTMYRLYDMTHDPWLI